LYNRPTSTWFTIWLDTGCGGQGIGGYKSSNPSDPNSWTHFCIHNNSQDDRESGWVDNNPSSTFHDRMYVSYNDFNVGGGALFVTYSSDNGTTWHSPISISPTFIRDVQITGDKVTGDVYIAGMDEMGGGLTNRANKSFAPQTAGTHGPIPTQALRSLPPGELIAPPIRFSSVCIARTPGATGLGSACGLQSRS
jgi:hypothetical protein